MVLSAWEYFFMDVFIKSKYIVIYSFSNFYVPEIIFPMNIRI